MRITLKKIHEYATWPVVYTLLLVMLALLWEKKVIEYAIDGYLTGEEILALAMISIGIFSSGLGVIGALLRIRNAIQ